MLIIVKLGSKYFSVKRNFQLKWLPSFNIFISFLSEGRGKHHYISHFVQPGVRPRQGKRKLSSTLSNSDLQFVHAFRRKQASTSCLSCDSASLHLQFPASSRRRSWTWQWQTWWIIKILLIDYKNWKRMSINILQIVSQLDKIALI